MSDPFLPREIVRRITGRARGSAQVRQLRRQGIRFLVNGKGDPIFDGDGFPLVPREAVMLADVYDIAQTEPDWSKMRRREA